MKFDINFLRTLERGIDKYLATKNMTFSYVVRLTSSELINKCSNKFTWGYFRKFRLRVPGFVSDKVHSIQINYVGKNKISNPDPIPQFTQDLIY